MMNVWCNSRSQDMCAHVKSPPWFINNSLLRPIIVRSYFEITRKCYTMYICMHACTYVLYTCMSVCMHVCMHACLYVCTYIYRHVYLACVCVCLCELMHMHVSTYVCMNVCLCVCVCARTCVCMRVSICSPMSVRGWVFLFVCMHEYVVIAWVDLMRVPLCIRVYVALLAFQMCI